MNNKVNKVALFLLCDSSSDSDLDLFTSSSDSFSSDSSSSDTLSSSASSSSEWDEEKYGKRTKTEDYLSIINKYSDLEFKQHFRLERSSVKKLIDYYKMSPHSTREQVSGREMVSVDSQIYIILSFLANKEPYRKIADRFNITKSSVFRILHRGITWIVKNSNTWIKWPSQEEMAINETKFLRKNNFPRVVGAIDSFHIKINAPREKKKSYYNRKKYYSIWLQAVVDADGKFLDVYCGEPGGIYCADVFVRSTFYNRMSKNPNLIPSANVILGSSTYPETNYLITPFEDLGILSDKQKTFNNMHSAARMVVHNAFRLLKRRFRRLQYLESPHLRFINNCVIAACALHNLCIIENDLGEWLEEDVNELNNYSCDEDDNNAIFLLAEVNESSKRDEIFDFLDSMYLLD